MSPTENAQLTEPDTVALPRVRTGALDDLDVLDAVADRPSLAPGIERSQVLRREFRTLVERDDDEPEEELGERAWQARRLATVLSAVALLALTVGVTLVGLGGTDQRRPEQPADAALAAARASAGQSRVSVAPSPVSAVAATPTVAAPTATPTASATTSPSATATATPSATKATPTAVRSSASATTKPSAKPSAKPTASQTVAAPTGPACSVAVSTTSTGLMYTAKVTVTNRGNAALKGWNVMFTLPQGYFVTGVTGAIWRQDATLVTVMNGVTLAKGAKATFGYTVAYAPDGPKAGSGYMLNSTVCR